MAKAKKFTILVKEDGKGTKLIEGAGRANKERELREACAAVCNGEGGEVWVTEENARAWAIWNCPFAAKEATRTRMMYK